jgi:chemotaxis signal transduction protein
MVHVDDPRGRWSVSASEVMRIIAVTEWLAAPPVDVLATLGPLPGGGTRRVLVMRGMRNRELALVAAGLLAVAEVDPHDVLPLPSVLAAATPQVSAIVVASDASLSLLIEPSAVISSSDTVVGEELCPSPS